MTVKNLQSIGLVDHTFSKAPARVASKRIGFQQIIVLLNGDRKSERVLSHALNVAREHQAELIVVHMYHEQSQEQANLYLKGVKNKLKAQYDAVQVRLYDGTNKLGALTSVMDSQKEICVMTAMESRNWLQRLWGNTLAQDFKNKGNVCFYEVDLTR